MTRQAAIPTTSSGDFEIAANGIARSVPAGSTVAAFLTGYGLDPDLVVVERNGRVLGRAAFDATLLQPGDELEIVHFVGGG